MKNKQILLICVGILMVVAVLTNPSQDRHKEVVKNKLNVIMQKVMKESLKNSDTGAQQIGSALGLMLGGAMLDRMIETMVTTDNYVLFSITKIAWEGKSKAIGFGVLGNVFISDEIDKALKDGKGLLTTN
jgi:Domain of unknown function (DUF4359)